MYFTGDREENEIVLPELQKVIEGVKLNRDILIKLYSGVENYDSMDFINEIKPVTN